MERDTKRATAQECRERQRNPKDSAGETLNEHYADFYGYKNEEKTKNIKENTKNRINKIKYNEKIKIASLNINGLNKAGTRQIVQ